MSKEGVEERSNWNCCHGSHLVRQTWRAPAGVTGDCGSFGDYAASQGSYDRKGNSCSQLDMKQANLVFGVMLQSQQLSFRVLEGTN